MVTIVFILYSICHRISRVKHSSTLAHFRVLSLLNTCRSQGISLVKGSVCFVLKFALPPFSPVWNANLKTKRAQNLCLDPLNNLTPAYLIIYLGTSAPRTVSKSAARCVRCEDKKGDSAKLRTHLKLLKGEKKRNGSGERGEDSWKKSETRVNHKNSGESLRSSPIRRPTPIPSPDRHQHTAEKSSTPLCLSCCLGG